MAEKSEHASSAYRINRNRGSYMSAHILLNLLNALGKGDKIRGLPSILSLFRNEFNKFNNTLTGSRILDSIYNMTLKLLIKSNFWRINVKMLPSVMQRYNGRTLCNYVTLLNLLTTSGLSILLHGVISLPGATSCGKTIHAFSREFLLSYTQKDIVGLKEKTCVPNFFSSKIVKKTRVIRPEN